MKTLLSLIQFVLLAKVVFGAEAVRREDSVVYVYVSDCRIDLLQSHE